MPAYPNVDEASRNEKSKNFYFTILLYMCGNRELGNIQDSSN